LTCLLPKCRKRLHWRPRQINAERGEERQVRVQDCTAAQSAARSELNDMPHRRINLALLISATHL